MTINLFNDNVDSAVFGIMWNIADETPTIALEPGDMASFDLDVYRHIPDGTKCRVFARQRGTALYQQSVLTFKYIKGYGFGGSFKFCMHGLKLALTYYRTI